MVTRQGIGSICELRPTQRIGHIHEHKSRWKNGGKDKAEILKEWLGKKMRHNTGEMDKRSELEESRRNPYIIACIPAYNEEKTIAKVILKTRKYVDKVIVCDDGSTDMTAEIAEAVGAEVIRLEKNFGKGVALKVLLERALELGANVMVTLDADGAHDPGEIPLILKPILASNPEADLVLGSRFMEGSCSFVSRLNYVGNRLINWLILLLTGKRLTDSQSGFRAFKARVLDSLDLVSKGYEVESEFTIKCIKHGYSILEVPIRCRKSPRASRLDVFKDGFKILYTVLKTAILED